MIRLALLAVIAFALVQSAHAMPNVVCGATCGGGGYSQLPACSSAYLGVTLYAQGYYWRCVSGPYHWAIV